MRFKREDFIGKGFMWPTDGQDMAQKLSDIANARLAEMIAEAPEFYGFCDDGSEWGFYERKGNCLLAGKYTHQARLICIEEIEK